MLLLLMMRMKCYGIESEKSLVVGKLFPKISRDLFFFGSRASSQFHLSGAGRGGAGRRAGPIVVTFSKRLKA